MTQLNILIVAYLIVGTKPGLPDRSRQCRKTLLTEGCNWVWGCEHPLPGNYLLVYTHSSSPPVC